MYRNRWSRTQLSVRNLIHRFFLPQYEISCIPGVKNEVASEPTPVDFSLSLLYMYSVKITTIRAEVSALTNKQNWETERVWLFLRQACQWRSVIQHLSDLAHATAEMYEATNVQHNLYHIVFTIYTIPQHIKTSVSLPRLKATPVSPQTRKSACGMVLLYIHWLIHWFDSSQLLHIKSTLMYMHARSCKIWLIGLAIVQAVAQSSSN